MWRIIESLNTFLEAIFVSQVNEAVFLLYNAQLSCSPIFLPFFCSASSVFGVTKCRIDP
jgi:hypothetical protein